MGSLPNELWLSVAWQCDVRTLAMVVGACRLFGDLARPCLDDRRVMLVRASVDAFMDRWERATAEWDTEWREDHPDPLLCEHCCDEDDAGFVPLDAAQKQSKRARWMCDAGVPGRDWANWVCDACARETLRHPSNVEGAMWPMRRIHLDVPHVWSVMQFDDYAESIHPTPRIPDSDFVVPLGVVRLLDRRAMDIVGDWVKRDTMVGWENVSPSSFSSLRAWLPLVGTHTAGSPRTYDLSRTYMPVVCCDRQSQVWGAIVLVEYDMTHSTATWWGIEDAIEVITGRWERRPADQQHLDNWVEWVREIYIERPHHVKKAERARTGYNRRFAWLDALQDT